MRTPGHAVLNVCVLSHWCGSARAAPLVAGALLPDVPLMLFYLSERLRKKTLPKEIWRASRERPGWRTLIHVAHSIPLTGLATVGALLGRSPVAVAFFASMLLHALADLPLHAEDAHCQLLPFSRYRFESPLSYWDERHHARTVALVETALVCLAASALWPSAGGAARAALALTAGWYLLGYFRRFIQRAHAAALHF